MRQRLVSSLLAIALLSTAAAARADLPPPDGTKFVGFSFKVENVAAFKGFALLAYPCGGSNGAPMSEMAEIKEGASISVGRRGGTCAMYAMPRADFDAWRAGVSANTGAAVDELFKSPKVRACQGAPQPTFTLPSSDARSVVSQTLRVTQLDAAGCVLTGGVGAPDQPPSTSMPATGGNGAPPTEPPPGGRGCAGCATAPREGLGLGLVAGALVAAVLGARRRRER